MVKAHRNLTSTSRTSLLPLSLSSTLSSAMKKKKSTGKRRQRWGNRGNRTAAAWRQTLPNMVSSRSDGKRQAVPYKAFLQGLNVTSQATLDKVPKQLGLEAAWVNNSGAEREKASWTKSCRKGNKMFSFITIEKYFQFIENLTHSREKKVWKHSGTQLEGTRNMVEFPYMKVVRVIDTGCFDQFDTLYS